MAQDASNAFWMIFKLSGLCFLISYLLVFPAFVLLRRQQPDEPRPYRMPGGMPAAWIAAVVCWLFIAFACALFFVPLGRRSRRRPRRETWLLAGETIATLVVGLVLMPRGADAIARRPAA